MKMKTFLLATGKLLLCSIAFILGTIIGGMVVTLFGLNPPPIPEGVDGNLAFLILMLESPLLVFSLILIGRGLGGDRLARALTLSIFTWVVYTLNTVIESLIFTTTTMEGALFTALSFLFPCIFVGLVVALLFPSSDKAERMITLVKEFFRRRTTHAWAWRIAVATVAFIPIYLFFGSLVAPITAQYFRGNIYGLRLPSQIEIFIVLSVRSVLFLLACLPVLVLWKQSSKRLFLNLGFALFVLVGFLYMLGAYYMPLAIRVPHTLEILADSFAYAGVLVLLLTSHNIQTVQTQEFGPTAKRL